MTDWQMTYNSILPGDPHIIDMASRRFESERHDRFFERVREEMDALWLESDICRINAGIKAAE